MMHLKMETVAKSNHTVQNFIFTEWIANCISNDFQNVDVTFIKFDRGYNWINQEDWFHYKVYFLAKPFVWYSSHSKHQFWKYYEQRLVLRIHVSEFCFGPPMIASERKERSLHRHTNTIAHLVCRWVEPMEAPIRYDLTDLHARISLGISRGGPLL